MAAKIKNWVRVLSLLFLLFLLWPDLEPFMQEAPWGFTKETTPGYKQADQDRQRIDQWKDSGEEIIMKLYGSKEAIETIQNPDKVILYKIRYPKNYRNHIFILPEAFLSNPIELTRQESNPISEDLVGYPDRYTLPFCGYPASAPVYTVKVTFQKADNKVAVFLCPHMGKTGVDPTGKKTLKEIDREHNEIFFASNNMYDVALKYFPDLKTKRTKWGCPNWRK